MQVGLKTWQAFKDHFTQAYRSYQIRKISKAAAHGYGASENHTQETEAQVNTADDLQTLACAEMEDKEEMANLTRINLTLSQSLTQAQEKSLVLSKQLQALQVHTKTKKPATKRNISHKPIGATRPARNKQQRPMGMGNQKIIHRRQRPKSTLQMICSTRMCINGRQGING